MIDHARLLELVHYDPATGVFTRRVSLCKRIPAGSVAGNLTHGYIQLSVGNTPYQAHRLAWFYVHGVWPSHDLDHIDRDRTNNRIANLRETTASKNQGNTAERRSNSLGYKGVTRHGKKFKAGIMLNRKRKHLGVFPDPISAAKAYDAAALTTFGEFAVTNDSLGKFR